MRKADHLLSILSGAFGAIALILSVLGLVGLLAYAVAKRTNEIGIRMAVGASEGDVVLLMLRDSLLLVASGIALGQPCAYLLGRLLKHQLFHLSAADPFTAADSLATWVPASHAARIDPMTALREE